MFLVQWLLLVVVALFNIEEGLCVILIISHDS